MLCQLCHSAEATVSLIETTEEKQSTLQLCETCAQKRHLGEMISKPAMAIHELMSSIMQLGQISESMLENLSCSKCGLQFNKFKQIGRFGCSHCYTAFKTNLLPILRQFHQAEEHKQMSKPKAVLSHQKQAKELRKALKDAIKQERYEIAAQLRDQLRSFEGADSE